MTKRGYIRLFSFSIAFALILAGYAIVNMNSALTYKAQLENNYQQSLNELSESLDLIETNLTKSVYSSGGEMLTDISRDLYSECTQAKQALSRLPVDQMNLNSTYKFITQSADYAAYLAKKSSSENDLTDEEHKNLLKLLSYAEKLNDSVSDMASIANSSAEIDTSDIQSESVSVSPLSTGFSGNTEVFKDYPTLLYDGPFADAVLNRTSSLLEESEEISSDEARDIAASAIGCNVSEISYEGEETGLMPCYTFSYSQKTVGITKKGGYTAYILYGGKITKSSIDEKNAVNIAKKYLENLGYENMSDTYYAVNNNICVINFAYTAKNTTYYADLIKVGVSMSDGSVVSLEAQGYLTNHINRTDDSCKLTKKQAKKCLSKYLTEDECKKCVIPKDDGTEVKCYEYHCKSSDTNEEVLVYVNADTGEEEDILLLLYSDNGTLTK